MTHFDVLDRTTDVHRSLFLEASAGTGKTFSIENIVTRLLMESDSCCLENILIVTFTRAATHDLKVRIRTQIQKALECLEAILSQSPPEDIADYLSAYAEKEEEAVKLAKKRLEQALFCYDEAPIHTIHSFCMRSLKRNLFEVGMGFHAFLADEQITPQQVIKVIRDFFRTGIRPQRYSASQLSIILKEHQQEIQKVENTIYRLLVKHVEIAKTPYFDDYLLLFNQTMAMLKKDHPMESSKIIADFDAQIPFYKKPKQTNLLEDAREKICRFASLFDQEQWSAADFDQLIADQLVFVHLLSPDLLKMRAKGLEEVVLHYPNLYNILTDTLAPIVQEAGSYDLILSRMACDCQHILNRVLAEEEKLGADDLLHAMARAIEQPSFKTRIRQSYRAVIIDEFQDTDPIQWTIFSTLFDTRYWQGQLYLVGDPKQSIYSFRQADIYTYLKAADTIGEQGKVCLNTNYRSQPSLIKGLNLLFSSVRTEGFIDLPSLGTTLPYLEVKSPSTAITREFTDNYHAIHFALIEEAQGRSTAWPSQMIEENYFFPFIAQEIIRLNIKDNVAYKECAILVRDRFQTERLAAFLKQYSIPVLSQRQTNLTEAQALIEWIDLLRAALNPTDNSAMRKALMTNVIDWTDEQITTLNAQETLQYEVFMQWQRLHHLLVNEGFITFHDALMSSKWSQITVKEHLLMKKNEVDFYQEFQQIAELMMEHQSTTQCHPEQLVRFLKEAGQQENSNSDAWNKRFNPAQDAVRIMTLHASKGLEFDIVFALGLTSRTPIKEEMIVLKDQQKVVLSPRSKVSEKRSLQHDQELDAEKMRLLYVGLTRAKHRLYIPVAFANDKQLVEGGTASPMELFLARLGQQSSPASRQSQDSPSKPLIDFIEAHATDCISYSQLKQISFPIPQHHPEPLHLLVKPKPVQVPGQPQFLYSFTGLIKSTSKENHHSMDFKPPQEANNPIKTPHTLPAGATTGIVLHAIFEKLPFDAVKEMDTYESLIPLIAPFLEEHTLQQWQNVIAEIVFYTLKTPLCGEWRLCDIQMEKTYREMEFLYPWSQQELSIEEISYQQGYLKGVIDLVFEHEGYYYIVDWKSNWLGPSADDYQQDQLHAAMESECYALQATIYQAALKRYLAIVESRPFEECFGGIFYLFARGVGRGASAKNGIYISYNPCLTSPHKNDKCQSYEVK